MRRLARSCYRHRRAVVGLWVVLLAGLIALSSVAGGVFKVDFALPGSETQRAFELLQEHNFDDRSGEQAQVVFQSDAGIADPAVQAAMEQLFSEIPQRVEGVTVVSPYSEAGSFQVSQDGTIGYAELQFSDRKSAQYVDDADEIRSLRDKVQVDGLEVELGSDIFAEEAFGSSEGIGLLLAVVILLVAFGSLLAMGLPIATALVGIGCGAAVVTLIANVMDMPDFTLQAVSMIVDRRRDRLRPVHRHPLPRSAPSGSGTRRAPSSSRSTPPGGRCCSPGRRWSSPSSGCSCSTSTRSVASPSGPPSACSLTMLASVTLLPALLGFVGHNIDRFGLPGRKRRSSSGKESFWYRWSRVSSIARGRRS